MADDSMPEYGKRPPIQLISIELIRRLAAQMDSGMNFNSAPFQSFLPLGWLRVDFEARVAGTDDIEPVRQLILVYEFEKTAYDAFIAALQQGDLETFEDSSVELQNVREQLDQWAAQFFPDAAHRIGMALVNDLFSVARHMAQNDKEPPQFFPFESRELHDLDHIAQRMIEERHDRRAEHESLQHEYGRRDRFWRSIYPKYEQFKSQFDACVNRALSGVANGTDANKVPPSAFGTPESIPDREPSEALKEQVKSRDGHCLCCGCTERRWLQVDHIAPFYTGGLNHLDNLQTLCKLCNQAKSILNISFRNNQTLLSSPSPQPSTISTPLSERTKDPDQWKMFLRRWVNLFYQCTATDTVEVGQKGERLRCWGIRLFPGNDPAWLRPHLEVLAQRIREARSEAGYSAAPDTILVNEPSKSPAVESEVEDVEQINLSTVLAAIENVERFRVSVAYAGGRQVRGDWTQGITAYPYKNAMRDESTVRDWRVDRFLKNYPVFDNSDFVVDILDGERYGVSGQSKLRTIRQSYFD